MPDTKRTVWMSRDDVPDHDIASAIAEFES
ncbi:MAG: hypothetical protein RL743_1604, partial [Actinomycetota bacterium]